MRKKKKTTYNRFFAILILAVFMLCMLLTSGCQSQKEAAAQYIGIVSAMDNEIELLLKEAKIDHIDTIGGVDYHVGTLHDFPVVITRAGIGKIRAASGVTALLNSYPILSVVFTGIAGGIADDTQVLDEVIATDLLEHDYGALTNDGFLWIRGDPAVSKEPGESYPCDPEMVELAYEAAVRVMGEEHVHKGTIVTGDQYISSEKRAQELKENHDAIACEMEGAAIAVVCRQYETPFVVIRALSDKADGHAHKSYENFADTAAYNSSRIILDVLDHLDN